MPSFTGKKLERVTDELSGADGIATFPAAAVAANGVSIAEVIRYISENQVERQATKTLATMETTAEQADSPVSLFTVTGDVKITSIVGVVATSVTSDGANGTLEVGVTGSTAILLPQIVINGTLMFVAGDVWASATAGVPAGVLGNSGSGVVLGGGFDIIMTVAINDMAGGSIKFYVSYIPLSSDGAVAAA